MTTIVYDHKNKQVACDSRRTAERFIITDEAIKYIKNKDDLWFIAGTPDTALTFVSHFKAMEEAHPLLDNNGIFVSDGSAYFAVVDDGAFCELPLDCSFATGSGENFAISALDMGKSAKDAIEYAMTRDCCTGGKVHVYDIEKGEFI